MSSCTHNRNICKGGVGRTLSSGNYLWVICDGEIITRYSMNQSDAQCRLPMLKTMAYSTQYAEWSKFLHLHAAISGKIKVVFANWDSDFEQVERMVLENLGKVDLSSRLGLRQPKVGRIHTGKDRAGNAHK